MKYLYIHCGLHKTGTTSLQHALRDNADKLLNHGILYPNIGVPKNHAGQHNLAWQMGRYRRFDPANGDWNALIDSIRDFDGSVLLSSEDFENSLLEPAHWKNLVSKFRKLDFQLVFVVYLRDPVTYLESLYLEHLKSGGSEEYRYVFNKVMRSRTITYDERAFCFHYPGIQKAISSLPNARLIFRNYDHLINDSVIDDFGYLLGLEGFFSSSKIIKNKNIRNSIKNSLKLFMRNRTWSWFEPRSPQNLYRVIDLLITHDNFRVVTSEKLRNELNESLTEVYDFLQTIHHHGVKNQTSKSDYESQGEVVSCGIEGVNNFV